MNDDAAYQRARKRVAAMRGFYIHLTVYLLVNVFLFLINIVTSPHYLWFYWPLLGWGIGLVAHRVSVFGFGGQFGHDWEERKAREIVERENRQSRN